MGDLRGIRTLLLVMFFCSTLARIVRFSEILLTELIEDACGGSSPPPETHASSGRSLLGCVRPALCEVSTFCVTILCFILSSLAQNSEYRHCAGVVLCHGRSTGCRLPVNRFPVQGRVRQFQNMWSESCSHTENLNKT